jgi:hypothetical protein
MRRRAIDLAALPVPPGWEAKAAAAAAAAAACLPEERSETISKKSGIWSEVKAGLGGLADDKCWYSEARQVGADRDVDHFRPKGAVAGTDHPGYWWLAFEKSNYRYSCIFCNRPRTDNVTGTTGGKHDQFPLIDPAARAQGPGDVLTLEQPVLLDPCCPGDPQLLTFAENGEALPRWSEESHPRKHRRARESIGIYHLNHTDFVRARTNLGERLKRLVENADRYYRNLEHASPIEEHAYSEAVREILELTSDDAEFSAYAKTVVENHKHLEWVGGLL